MISLVGSGLFSGKILINGEDSTTDLLALDPAPQHRL